MITDFPEVVLAIKEANPDIIDIKFGCVAHWTSPASEENRRKPQQHKVRVLGPVVNGTVDIMTDSGPNMTQRIHTVMAGDLYAIVGREIRLDDVIATLYVGEFDSQNMLEDEAAKLHQLCIMWKHGSLNMQDDDTLGFIQTLLP